MFLFDLKGGGEAGIAAEAAFPAGVDLSHSFAA
jgi:hypothetical protein